MFAFKENLPELIEQRDSELPDNDSDINHMKRQLFKAIKLIKLMQSQGYMMDNEVSDHVRRLKVITLKTEVNAYIQQGRQYVENEERTTAATYFKHAKEMLVASELSFPDRARMIRRISKMIMGLYSTQEDEEELDKELGFSKNLLLNPKTRRLGIRPNRQVPSQQQTRKPPRRKPRAHKKAAEGHPLQPSDSFANQE